MESKESSFFYIFRAPIEKVFNVFRSPTLLTCTFFQNAKILSMKHEDSALDSAGNEITMLWNGVHTFTLKVDNTINLPYFKMFNHRSIANPSSFSPFEHNFSFFWNSTDKVTVFKFTAWIKDSEEKNTITKYIMENKDSMCLSTENYLMKTLINLEENESISISKPIDNVWAFVSNVKNQCHFYNNTQSIVITEMEGDKILIEDLDNQTKTTFGVKKHNISDDKKQLELELIAANVSLPKQKITFNLIKMDDKQCFLIFKHLILEFIPYDILMSYSSSKKKVLRKVKAMLESI
jgi:hypothetical protein